MITIRYHSTKGSLIADGNVINDVTRYLELIKLYPTLKHEYYTSSGLVIDQFRIRIKRGEIPVDGIQFIYETDDSKQVIPHDRDGNLLVWPAGFCDHNEKQLEELIGW